MPFVLTSNEIHEYYIRYLGWQKVDEIGCYVFAVKPKVSTNPRSAILRGKFGWTITIYQIVKTYGRASWVF